MKHWLYEDTPLAMRVKRELGSEWARVAAHGRLTKEDVVDVLLVQAGVACTWAERRLAQLESLTKRQEG